MFIYEFMFFWNYFEVVFIVSYLIHCFCNFYFCFFIVFSYLFLHSINLYVFLFLLYNNFASLFPVFWSNLNFNLLDISSTCWNSVFDNIIYNIGLQYVIQSHDRAFFFTCFTAWYISLSSIEFMIYNGLNLVHFFGVLLPVSLYSFIHSCCTAFFAFFPFSISPCFVL